MATTMTEKMIKANKAINIKRKMCITYCCCVVKTRIYWCENNIGF